MTGCGRAFEWMLPWWFDNYSRHNGLPVVFADFGMSDRALVWCRARGEVVRNPFCVAHEHLAKPFMLLQSPFAMTMWIDLDGEVRGAIDDAFGACEAEVAVVPNNPGAFDPIQAGVLVVRHGSEIVREWAALCRDWKRLDRIRIATRHFDQSLLAHIWRAKPGAFTPLDGRWNLGRQFEPADDTVIHHWWGRDGKHHIRSVVTSRPNGDGLRALESGPLSRVLIGWSDIRKRLLHLRG
jgi:hypothetical protein